MHSDYYISVLTDDPSDPNDASDDSRSENSDIQSVQTFESRENEPASDCRTQPIPEILHEAACSCWFDMEGSRFRNIIDDIGDIAQEIPSDVILSTLPTTVSIFSDNGQVAALQNVKHCSRVTLLHLAAGCGNYRVVGILLGSGKINVNVLDSNGNTPLHYCAVARFRSSDSLANYSKCASLLANVREIELNITNGSGYSVFQVAAKCGNIPVLKLLLNHCKTKLDPQLTRCNKKGSVLDNLAKCDVNEFWDALAAQECANLLINVYENDADRIFEGCTATHKAARSSNLTILKSIMENKKSNTPESDILGKSRKNVLHYAVDEPKSNDEKEEKAIACVEYILSRDIKLLNTITEDGNTALQLALVRNKKHVALCLMKKGAWIINVNNCEEKTLDLIAPDTMKSYFDYCIHTDKNDLNKKKCRLVYEYKFASIRRENDNTKSMGMEVVYFIANHSHMKHLLAHPLITSYLCLKYHKTNVCRWISANIIFYTLFLAVMTLYLGLRTKLDSEGLVSITLKVIMGLQSVIFLVRELVQIRAHWKKYIANVENWVEISLIACTLTIISSDFSEDSIHKRSLAGVTMILSWLEFVLLTGKLPVFSTQYNMLKTVMATFFRYMLWYLFIVIAFAMCFFVVSDESLSRMNASANEGNTSKSSGEEETDLKTRDSFYYPMLSIERAIVMFSGELNYDEFPIFTMSLFEHAILIGFILIISIVLLNLLNGLAVSDTQAIKNDAKILSVASRINQIQNFENTLANIRETYKFLSSTATFDNLFRSEFKKKMYIEKTNRDEASYNIILKLYLRIKHHFNLAKKFKIEMIDTSIIKNTKELIREKRNRATIGEDVLGGFLKKMESFECEMRDRTRKIHIDLQTRFMNVETSILICRNKLRKIEALMLENAKIIEDEIAWDVSTQDRIFERREHKTNRSNASL